jgi:hypothetical protein
LSALPSDFCFERSLINYFQLIQEKKARLQFFQEHLEYQVDRSAALQYLKDKYESFLTGVFTEETAQEDSRFSGSLQTIQHSALAFSRY